MNDLTDLFAEEEENAPYGVNFTYKCNETEMPLSEIKELEAHTFQTFTRFLQDIDPSISLIPENNLRSVNGIGGLLAKLCINDTYILNITFEVGKENGKMLQEILFEPIDELDFCESREVSDLQNKDVLAEQEAQFSQITDFVQHSEKAFIQVFSHYGFLTMTPEEIDAQGAFFAYDLTSEEETDRFQKAMSVFLIAAEEVEQKYMTAVYKYGAYIRPPNNNVKPL